MGRATTFYETIFKRSLLLIGDPTGETKMHSFAVDMGAYGAGGALVQSPFSSGSSSSGRAFAAPQFSIGEFGWAALRACVEGKPFGLNSMR